jgi:hypothetical protein
MMIASPAKVEQASVFVMAVTALLSAVTVLPGAWGLIAPEAFGEFVRFPLSSASEHFVHDSGAFAVGMGAALGFSLIWRDGYVVALSGFLVANTLHTINHVVDRHLGGYGWDAWALGFMSILTATALIVRLRQSSLRAAR